MPIISYAQRFEDLYLARCFPDQTTGFYIDLGAGHPVHDNVSFAFYLRSWRGITVEPNPALAELTKAVRPRDDSRQALVGPAAGQATFYLVDEFHGFSTVIESHAEGARREFGKPSRALPLPMTTLAHLCEQGAPAAIDFLKVDVEGYEHEVLLGGDWQRFRPKVVLVEALAPFSLAPAWEAWEPLLFGNGYRYVFFDSLNRYYVAQEAGELAAAFETAPKSFDDTILFGTLGQALDDRSHPDHHLAHILASCDMARLPLLDHSALLEAATAGLARSELDRPSTKAELDACWRRLFGAAPLARNEIRQKGGTVRDLYAQIIKSDAFRTACGRISASYAW